MTLLAALLGAMIISFSAILFALSEVSPITGGFYRAVYALPVLAVLWFARRNRDTRPARKHWIALGAGLALGLDIIAWHSSIEYIGAGLSTLIANSQVVFVALAAWALHNEKPSRRVALAIPVVMLGVAMVSGVGQEDAFGSNPLLGTVLALLAALLYAVFLLGFRNSNDAHAPPAGPLMEATAGALLMTVVLGLVGSGIEFGFTWPAHGWLLALALGPQVAGWLLIGYALPRLPAAETSTIILLQPALTMIWGALIFDERPSLLQVLGAVIVLTGVGMVAVARARAQVAPAT